MKEKVFPISQQRLEEIIAKYPTPFHIYDEKAIRANIRRLFKAFSWAPEFREHFAVKATPNPRLMQILAEEGAGSDCSSLAELCLSEAAGITGEKIMLTSNDTPADEFQKAIELGAVINLDDITHIEYLEKHAGMPKIMSFRYNPGNLIAGNDIIGKPMEAKYGLTHDQILEAYKMAQDRGVKRFGLHCMVISNELRTEGFALTASIMFNLAKEIKEKLGITLEFVNLGGGIGIPYEPSQEEVNLEEVGEAIHKLYDEIMEKALAVGIGCSSPERIDEINILQATFEAMTMAVNNLKVKPGALLIDAVHIPQLEEYKQISIIKGDAKSVSIAAASIIAKVTRDRLMKEMALKYPQYAFDSNKGYGTAAHIAALKEYGPCEIHRRSFIGNFV